MAVALTAVLSVFPANVSMAEDMAEESIDYLQTEEAIDLSVETPVLERKDIGIAVGQVEDLSADGQAPLIMGMEEGTVIIKFKSDCSNQHQSLFSVSNATSGNQDRHFHLYVTNAGGVGMELRNTDGSFKYTLDRPAAVRSLYKGQRVYNTIAFKADKEHNSYKLFAKSLTGETTYGSHIFYAGDATKANYFRIPSLLALESGTVLAAADARYGGTHDSKSKIDIAFAKSTDGGQTWSEPVMPLKFEDYVSKNIEWPRDSVGKNVQIQGSASYIDPVLLEDRETNRVFLFADLMPAGIGSSNAAVGLGFKEINGKKYLKLRWHEDKGSDYNYTIRENGVIYNDITGEATEYQVDGKYNLYQDGNQLTCKQYDYNFEGTKLLETKTDADVILKK